MAQRALFMFVALSDLLVALCKPEFMLPTLRPAKKDATWLPAAIQTARS